MTPEFIFHISEKDCSVALRILIEISEVFEGLSELSWSLSADRAQLREPQFAMIDDRQLAAKFTMYKYDLNLIVWDIKGEYPGEFSMSGNMRGNLAKLNRLEIVMKTIRYWIYVLENISGDTSNRKGLDYHTALTDLTAGALALAAIEWKYFTLIPGNEGCNTIEARTLIDKIIISDHSKYSSHGWYISSQLTEEITRLTRDKVHIEYDFCGSNSILFGISIRDHVQSSCREQYDAISLLRIVRNMPASATIKSRMDNC